MVFDTNFICQHNVKGAKSWKMHKENSATKHHCNVFLDKTDLWSYLGTISCSNESYHQDLVSSSQILKNPPQACKYHRPLGNPYKVQKYLLEFFFLHQHHLWIQSCGTGDHTDTFTVSSSFNTDPEMDITGYQLSVATDLFTT